MNRWSVGVLTLLLGSVAAAAQSLDDLSIQIHGYATQGFIYATNNNIVATESSNGSPAWTEAALSVSAQPIPKLRNAAQARYFPLGSYGDSITLDWAMSGYKFDGRIGVRFGEVKTPWGLMNETQGVDPSNIWSLLPQSVYPIISRNSYLAHYGGVVSGTIRLSPKAGKFEYRAFGGDGLHGSDDGIFLTMAEAGFNLPNDGIKGPLYVGALHWRRPLPGLMVGASDLTEKTWHAPMTANNGAMPGTFPQLANRQPNFFAIYDKDKIMVAFEYEWNWENELTQLPSAPISSLRNDDRSLYAMASYKLTGKLTAGAYDSENSGHQAPPGAGLYQKDWGISGRYDFNQYLDAKAKQHFTDGTGLGYDTTLNTGLQPNTQMTLLKAGVSF